MTSMVLINETEFLRNAISKKQQEIKDSQKKLQQEMEDLQKKLQQQDVDVLREKIHQDKLDEEQRHQEASTRIAAMETKLLLDKQEEEQRQQDAGARVAAMEAQLLALVQPEVAGAKDESTVVTNTEPPSTEATLTEATSTKATSAISTNKATSPEAISPEATAVFSQRHDSEHTNSSARSIDIAKASTDLVLSPSSDSNPMVSARSSTVFFDLTTMEDENNPLALSTPPADQEDYASGPKLSKPLSELTNVPLVDVESLVNRSTEERLKEVEPSGTPKRPRNSEELIQIERRHGPSKLITTLILSAVKVGL